MKTLKFIVFTVLLIFVINYAPKFFGGENTLNSEISKHFKLKDDVEKIRNGHLEGTSRVTIASALEGYFSSPEWGETEYYDMRVVVFQGEFQEDGVTQKFQILFPKISEYKKYGMAADINLDKLTYDDLFLNNMVDEGKAKEQLIKAYEAAGEKLE
ncbi:hypothetical protein G8C92_06505 [Paenibacillus donghaensis]|uniref:hypothetical protein n=1 Tax=Paenibacillus donghaensis TaxID=414771 RepID=UPI001883AFFC|nr:hypothetical protein [Paenibacillus donghaensis]MBE9913681.1 hypothetical protein [Paenibacillus donghaensis]